MAGQMRTFTSADEPNQTFLLQVVDVPQLLVRDLGDAPLPEKFIHQILAPGRREILVIQLRHLVAHPRERVNPVRNGLNSFFAGFQVLENMPPHVIADVAVELADSVAERREMQRKHGQAERLIALAGIRKAEVDKLIHLDANILAVVLVVLADQPGIESFIARGHGRVRRKDRVLGNLLTSLAKARPAFDDIANAFEPEERAVPLVHVPTGRLDPERLQRAYAADTEHDLLANAHLPSADIKLARNCPVGGIVLVRVGVQQQYRHATHLRQPDAREHLAVGEIDANCEVAAIVTEQGLDGQARKIIRRVKMLLSSVRLDLLLKVPMLIKRADADEWDSEIARGFTMIAGEHTEAAGIRTQTFVKTEFGREINKRAALVARMVLGEPRVVERLHVRLELALHGLVHAEEHLVLQQHFPVGRLNVNEQLDRIAIDR